jgi:predicted RNA methylase
MAGSMFDIDWKGRLGPMRLKISETTFQPSTVTRLLADTMVVEPGDVVFDVGCGSGILGIIAAKLGAGRCQIEPGGHIDDEELPSFLLVRKDAVMGEDAQASDIDGIAHDTVGTSERPSGPRGRRRIS